MADSKRTWISIAIAALIIVGVLGLALVGGIAYFVYDHVRTQITTPGTAAAEFERERGRFIGQEPLIEIHEESNESIVRRHPDAPAHSADQIEAIHALAFDPKARKLVRVSIPMWLLRLMPQGRVRLFGSDSDFDSARMRLTLADIERHGRGLILDSRMDNGTQVLVWAY